MSSRALRRLQEQKKEIVPEEDDNEDEFVAANVVRKKNKKKKAGSVNPFEVLADGDIEDEEEVEQVREENPENFSETDVNNVTKKTTKKKNKKKKSKQKNISNSDVIGLDEIDRSIKEVNEILGIDSATVSSTGVTSSQNTSIFKSRSVLVVDPRNLNPDTEMKRRFGASVLQNDRRRNPHERRFRRTSCLVTPKPSWPPYHKVGITMNKVNSEDCSSVFTFEHQETYRKVQFMFYDAVESIDHNNIIALLNAHPYHIDSMLQLSEICKMNEDFQMASELIERALFVFENSFHTMFNITQGTCRLQYKRSENRPFFLALFRHIHYLGDKACYRTALEFCKVLLGLDCSEDPLCVLLLIDYYALKAEEYDYLVQVADEYEYARNLSLLPNFAYSYALAKFYLGKVEEADTAIRNALVSFPSLLVELMDKNGISLDDKIKTNPYFDPVSYIGQSAPLNQLVSLYVGRCCSLWKDPDVLNWLVANCTFIIDNPEKFSNQVVEAAERRLSRYKSSPRNILRHIVISDIKEASRALPVEIRNQTVMQHDPLPPLDSVTGYERPTRVHQRQQSNLFSLFLQSFLPSYNQNEPRPLDDNLRDELRNQAVALDNPDDQNGMNALQGGAQQLMNAMRELLNTMTYRNDGVENENEADVDEDWED